MGLDQTFKDYDNNFSCDTIEEWIEHLGTVESVLKRSYSVLAYALTPVIFRPLSLVVFNGCKNCRIT